MGGLTFVCFSASIKLKCYFQTEDIPNPFASPAVEGKLRAHPKTNAYMNDPVFLAELKELKSNPNWELYGKDKRLLEALAVLLGVDLASVSGAGELCTQCNDYYEKRYDMLKQDL